MTTTEVDILCGEEFLNPAEKGPWAGDIMKIEIIEDSLRVHSAADLGVSHNTSGGSREHKCSILKGIAQTMNAQAVDGNQRFVATQYYQRKRAMET